MIIKTEVCYSSLGFRHKRTLLYGFFFQCTELYIRNILPPVYISELLNRLYFKLEVYTKYYVNSLILVLVAQI
jgi:hypothetical protein